MKQKRPFLIWIISLVFVGFSIFYAIEAVQTLQSWNVLITVQYQPGPLYPFFQGLFLSLCFLAAAVLIWMRVYWAPAFDTLVLCVASLWFWLDRLVLSANPRPISGQIFALVVFLLLFALMLASLWVLKPYMLTETPVQEEENESKSS